MSNTIRNAQVKLAKLAGAAILSLVAVLYGIAGLTTIEPGEVGLLVKQFGSERGMQDETLDTGTHWIDPFIYDVPVYDTRLRQELLEDVASNTADGQPILVDVSLEFGLLSDKVPGLHENVGRDYFDQIVYPAARSSIRNITSTQGSDAIYTGEGRAAVQNQLSEHLAEKLEPMGIRISANLRDIQFVKEDFVQTLEAKAKAAQQEIIQTRLAAAAVQEAIKVKNQAEGEKFKREQAAQAQQIEVTLAAEADRDRRRLEGIGEREKQEEVAKGILAVGKSEADVIKLKASALVGSGGQLYRDIEVLGGLGRSVEYYGTPTGAPGTSTYIVDEALRGKIAVGGGAEK